MQRHQVRRAPCPNFWRKSLNQAAVAPRRLSQLQVHLTTVSLCKHRHPVAHPPPPPLPAFIQVFFFFEVANHWDKLQAFILPMVVENEKKIEGTTPLGSDRPVS